MYVSFSPVPYFWYHYGEDLLESVAYKQLTGIYKSSFLNLISIKGIHHDVHHLIFIGPKNDQNTN